jgi:hypothetical protein
VSFAQAEPKGASVFDWNKRLTAARNKQIAKNKKKKQNKENARLSDKIFKLKKEIKEIKSRGRKKHTFYDSESWLRVRFLVLK